MHLERSIDIDADPARVWAVMADIERWPQWTRSVTKVEARPSPTLAADTEARITQPRLGARTWRVTALDAPRSFTWETSGPATSMVATHSIAPRGEDGSTVTLVVDSGGWAVTLFGWLLASTGRRFVDMEAEGLKREAESA